MLVEVPIPVTIGAHGFDRSNVVKPPLPVSGAYGMTRNPSKMTTMLW